MKSYEVVFITILFLLSLTAFVFSYFQFKEKGILLNNAYLYASKSEREKIEKKPYYRQSAIVFVMIGILFFFNALQFIIKSSWVEIVVNAMFFLLIGYAIVSSVKIARRKI